MRNKIIIWALVFIVIIGIIGGAIYLSKSKKENNGAILSKFKFSVNSWVGFGPMYLAKEKGFFKDEGIDVEISLMDDQAQRTAAITKGDIDGYGDTVDLLVLTRANNIPAVSVMQADFSNGADGIVVSDNIKSVKDLKGKKIAAQKNFVGENFLYYVLKKNGIALKDVEIVDMESGAAGAAFVAGSVDAAVTFEPWLSKAKEREGGKMLVSSSDEPGVIVDTFSINETYLKNNPENVKKIMRGWFKAVDFWKNNPTEANEIMAKAYKLQTQEFADFISGLKWPNYQENLTYFGTQKEHGKIYEVADTFNSLFIELEVIQLKTDVNKAIDRSLLYNLY